MLKKIKIIYGRLARSCYSLIAPRSKAIDQARREIILNILLIGSISLSFIALISSTISLTQIHFRESSEYLFIYILVWVVFLIFAISYYLSRTGRSKLTAYVLIALYYLAATLAALTWGIEITSSILIYALLIVLSGILIGSRFSFFIAGLISLSIISITLLHQNGIVHANLTWKYDLPLVRDGVMYSSILFTIALVSWLFNREMERALERARASEAEVKRQRDQLEIIVAERTQELKKVQVEKLTQLYRFAEFGKLSSGLFHELVTPLNLVSLNLQQLKKSSIESQLKEKIDKSLERALLGTTRIEKYLSAARKQIQTQDVSIEFSAIEEIEQVLQMLKYKATKEKVKLQFEYTKNTKLVGNPLKFNQLLTNIITNGIDAYDKVQSAHKYVKVVMKVKNNTIIISIQDWGCGMSSEVIPKIYEPLFTTKTFDKGTGIGLALCKDIIEKDFMGTIQVESSKGKGTTFTLKFPLIQKKKRRT